MHGGRSRRSLARRRGQKGRRRGHGRIHGLPHASSHVVALLMKLLHIHAPMRHALTVFTGGNHVVAGWPGWVGVRFGKPLADGHTLHPVVAFVHLFICITETPLWST